MLKIFVPLLALLLALPTSAQTARAARKQAESSVRVTGNVVIGTDGTVQEQALETPLSPKLQEFVTQAIQQWRFEPVKVEGAVVRAKVPMSLRLVAHQAEDGSFSVRIVGTHFGADSPEGRPKLIPKNPPKFPVNLMRAGIGGKVFLVVQVGADGNVRNVDAEQVNLYVAGTEQQMQIVRKQLADASISAARKWKFTPPTEGPDVGKESWLARVPVSFTMGNGRLKAGQWETYIPGPRNVNIPWAQEKLKTAGSPDALPNSGVFSLGQDVKLLTPPTA